MPLKTVFSGDVECAALISARCFQVETVGHNSSTRRGHLRRWLEQCSCFSPADQQKLSGQCHQASLSSIYYLKVLTGLRWFTLRHLYLFFSPTVHPPSFQYHRWCCVRPSQQPQATAWHIKGNQNQSQFTLIWQTIIWDDSTCFHKQQRLEQLEASHIEMFLTNWTMLAHFILVFCLLSVLHMGGRGNNLLHHSSSGRPTEQQHISKPQISCTEL